jgi:hypothetical protein
MAPNTPRQGQSRGQGQRAWTWRGPTARLLGPAAMRRRRIIQAIRAAASAGPEAWDCVSAATKNSLLIPTAKVEVLGASRDDLLAELEFYPLPLIVLGIEAELQRRHDEAAARGRAALANVAHAREIGAENARANSRAHGWLEEVESRRRPGLTKSAKYADIERREGLQPGSVKKAIDRLRKRLSLENSQKVGDSLT